MTPERWKEINRVFQSALEAGPERRSEYLREACRDDRSLRDQVETLLAANEQAGDFMSGNAAQDVGHLIEETETPDVAGKMIGHYEVVKVLGRGGMGKVYLCHDSKLNRNVALKTLPSSLKGAGDFLRRFQTEAKAAANINHPNVATVYSVEETQEKRIFMTMEYVEGKPLSELIPRDGLDLHTFLDWFVLITDALTAAHEKGVIHRDIKPGNIMITDVGAPKILDFGLARIERTAPVENASTMGLTKTGQVIGTPAYMSPEQAEGSQTDRRSDIFSLGVVMYEAITGTRPFKGDNYASIVSKLLTLDPRPVGEIRNDVPALLSRLIMKCLSREPRRRYQSMTEIRVILEEMRAAIDSGATFAGTSPTEVAPASPNRLVPVLAALAAVLVILSGFFAWKWLSSPVAGGSGVTRFSLEPPPGQELSLFEAALSRDGSKIVFATRRTDLKNLFVRPMDQLTAIELLGTENARTPFFSPDGQWIGFFIEGGTLKKIPAGGGSALRICDDCLSPYGAFWVDEKTIVIAGQNGLYSISPEGGEKKELTKLDESAGEKAHRAPQALPDGRILFSKVFAEKVQFAILDPESGETVPVEGVEGVTSAHGGTSLAVYIDSGHLLFGKDGQMLSVGFDPGAGRVNGNPVPILEGLFAIPNLQVAGNGTLVYLPKAETSDNLLVWVDRQGESTPVFDKRADYRSPHLSPDGKRIAVQVDSDIWVYEISTGRGIRLTYQDNNQSPLWSADGGSVFYSTNTGDLWKIYRKPADGTGDAEELFSSEERHLPYSAHPTEPVIALSTVPSANDSDIVILSIPEKKVTPLIKTAFKEDAPKFSPDGSSIAYFSMETGKVQVYLQPWDGNGTRTTVSQSGGMLPVWSRDGKELFFRSGPKLLVSNIEAGTEGGSPPAPKVLFEGRFLTGFDVSRDGSSFLMVRSESGTMPKRLNVVLNWTSELRGGTGPEE